MKKYHLFSGYSYYPDSGLGDYKGSFEELEEALTAGGERVTIDNDDWFVVIGHSDDGALVELNHSRRNL